MIRSILIGALLSVDVWIAGAVYGREKIRAGWTAAVLTSGVGAAVLWVSMSFSGLLLPLVGAALLRWLGAGLLLLLGLRTLLRELSEASSPFPPPEKPCFLLELTVKQELADADRSKTLSLSESVWLALAMSLDTAGAGLGLGDGGILPAVLSAAAFTLPALPLGGLLGRLLPQKHGWIGGACLMALGLLRLLG